MSLVENTGRAVARPLKVLVPLIKQDLERADEAGMVYYKAAGEKMVEAKEQLSWNEFSGWCKRNFDISDRQARRYMSYANTTPDLRRARPDTFTSLRSFERSQGTSTGTGKTTWHEPVKAALGRVDLDAMRQDTLKRNEERQLQRELALQLIDIGFKALAAKLHPDKGGSREAMSRLNEVRNRLKSSI